jgi:hypothetical protein
LRAKKRMLYRNNMKTTTFWNRGAVVVLCTFVIATGCAQQSTNLAPAGSATDKVPGGAAEAITVISNTPSTTAAQVPEAPPENAPGKLVSTAAPPPQEINISSPAAEIAKLAQAGVAESVMLSFVTNSPYRFYLTSDAIIYLNDIGVSDAVVTAMIEHDQAANAVWSGAGTASAPPVYTNQLDSTGSAPAPYAPEAADVAESQTATESGQPPQGSVSYEYFHDALAPYGNWIYVEGYGMCWQPTVVVVNPYWQPYCDRGHWVYTDYGWYWASDYSWGWAPFHYGRWFRHHRWGWCWWPDRVWGPSWVTWRYADDYCGWAPLPPWTLYAPGFGFTYYGHSVGFSFGFGLSWDWYVFVPTSRFCDRHWYHHRVPRHHAEPVFRRTIVANDIAEISGRPMNRGIRAERIAAASRTEIRQVHLRDVNDPVSARAGHSQRSGRTMAVFRPDPITSAPAPRNISVSRSETPSAPSTRQPRGTAISSPRGRQTEAVPVFRNQPSAAVRERSAGSVRDPGVRTLSGDQATPVQSRPDQARPSTSERPRVGHPSSPPAMDSPSRPTPPQNNSPRTFPRQEQRPSASLAPRVSAPAPVQSQVTVQQNPPRREQPRLSPRNDAVTSQPSAPVQRQPAPVFQAPRPAETHGPSRSFAPAPGPSASPPRSEPSGPATPRVEPRQAPRSEPAPAPQRSESSSRDRGNSSRRNR